MTLAIEIGFGVGQAAGAATAAGISAGGAAAYFSPWAWRQRRMSRIRRQVADSRVLALTYDDGPSNTVTPEILDLLGRRGVHATFFMLGCNARQYPEVVDRAIAEGHEVGCHTYRHLNAWKTTPWRAVADIQAGYEGLSRWIRPDALFRPPHGKMTLPTYWELRRRGAPVWWWTLDSGDTNATRPEASEVADWLRRDRGGIVLMHDLDRGQERRDFVLKTTEALLDVAKRESMRVVTLGELCRTK
jgi:peptidoglycan/xylan/chitin deacetylase (PgdA/CDA1 family)